MELDSIKKAIYLKIHDEIAQYNINTIKLIFKRNFFGNGPNGFKYTYGISYLNESDSFDDITNYNSKIKYPYLFEYFDTFYILKGTDYSWNKVIFTLNDETQSCDIEYVFDSKLDLELNRFQQHLKDTEWKGKFEQGLFTTQIFNELVQNRGIGEDLADNFLGLVLCELANTIDEKWREAFLTIETKPISFYGYYIDLEGKQKQVDLGRAYGWKEPEVQAKTIKLYKNWTDQEHLYWTRAEFYITFDGEFTIKLINVI